MRGRWRKWDAIQWVIVGGIILSVGYVLWQLSDALQWLADHFDGR